MTRISFLVGISAIAFAAGAANAQSTTTTDGANNTRTTNCVGGSPANNCTVNNSTTTNASNTNNTGTAQVFAGTGNTATVTQNGNNLNGQIGIQGGNNNYALVNQGGNNNSGSIATNGTFNTATVTQTAAGANNNSASISQTGTITGTATFANNANTQQAGSGNSATINQTRTAGAAAAAGGNFAQVYQGTGGGGLPTGSVGTITQSGTALVGYVNQYDFNGSGLAISGNRAVISETGLGSSGTIFQGSRGNSATLTLLDGGLSANSAQNGAYVQQQNTRIEGTAATGSDTAAITAATVSNNIADLAVRGLQNYAYAYQDGVSNSSKASILGGGTGNTGGAPAAGFPASRPEGNQSYSNQYGRSNSYEISVGTASTNPGGPRGNFANVQQGNSGARSNVTNARNMSATVYQRGTADTVNISQQNNTATINLATTVQAGSYANVSQLSVVGSATINQTGTNSASLTQGLNADNSGGFQTLTLNQTDAGDAPAASGSGPFGGGSGTQVTTQNTFNGAQYGLNNVATVTQNTINGSVVLFQARDSRANTATITQGTGGSGAGAGAQGANSLNLFATVTQQGRASTATVNQDATNTYANVTQQGGVDGTGAAAGNTVSINQQTSFQSATVIQSGYTQAATVSQLGANAMTDSRSLATINQSGDRQTAAITQSATSGASLAAAPASGPTGGSASLYPNARAAGINSAESVIIQTGSRNSASITQNGRGQYARVEQRGILNSGTITQDAAADNAVAILEQTGNGNTYTIAQGAGDAGAYIRVQQTGNQNAAISTTTFGTGGTGTPGAPNAGPF